MFNVQLIFAPVGGATHLNAAQIKANWFTNCPVAG